MLGELFCQLGTKMFQKINEHKMKMAQLVMFKAAVSNKLIRHPQLQIDLSCYQNLVI